MRLLVLLSGLLGLVFCKGTFVVVKHPLPRNFVFDMNRPDLREVKCKGTANLHEHMIIELHIDGGSECANAIARVFSSSGDGNANRGYNRSVVVSRKELGYCTAVKMHSVGVEYESARFAWTFECTDLEYPNNMEKVHTWEWFIWTMFAMCVALPLILITANCAFDRYTANQILRTLRAWKCDVAVDLKKRVLLRAAPDEKATTSVSVSEDAARPAPGGTGPSPAAKQPPGEAKPKSPRKPAAEEKKELQSQKTPDSESSATQEGPESSSKKSSSSSSTSTSPSASPSSSPSTSSSSSASSEDAMNDLEEPSNKNDAEKWADRMAQLQKLSAKAPTPAGPAFKHT